VTPLITTRRLPPTESTPLIPNPLNSIDDHNGDNDDNINEKQTTTTHHLTKRIDEKTLRAPKTPVTVQSTFDDAFRRQSEVEGSVGSRVDLKVLEGEKVRENEVEVEGEGEGVRRLGNRRGVGPGIT